MCCHAEMERIDCDLCPSQSHYFVSRKLGLEIQPPDEKLCTLSTGLFYPHTARMI